MKQYTTRAIAVGAALALVVGTAACGSDDDGVEDDIRAVVTEVADAVDQAATDVADAADEAARDVVELAARNFAAVQGGQEFDAAGYPLADDLSCTASAADGLTTIEIECSGTTTEGGDAVLTGTTSEVPGGSFDELEGDFVGTVDGAVVFETDRLGG